MPCPRPFFFALSGISKNTGRQTRSPAQSPYFYTAQSRGLFVPRPSLFLFALPDNEVRLNRPASRLPGPRPFFFALSGISKNTGRQTTSPAQSPYFYTAQSRGLFVPRPSLFLFALPDNEVRLNRPSSWLPGPQPFFFALSVLRDDKGRLCPGAGPAA